MVPGFGKQTLTVGSDPGCDVVLQGAGVAAEHGKLVHQGGGRLVFINGVQSQTTAAGRGLGPGEQVAFDFRTPFHLGAVALPFDHPAIALSLMTRGQQDAPAGRMVIGRDPTQVSIVLQHPSVSSRHCSVAMDRMMVTDNDSTSGTYVSGQRIPANTPTPLPQQGVVHIGPVPLPVSLLNQLASAGQNPGGAVAAPAAQPWGAAPAAAAAAPQVSSGAQVSGSPQMKKHKTVFGQLDFGAAVGGTKTVGRTPNNDIVIPHPQVSSSHAQVEEINGQLFVTDRGSANGTYVRGHRIAPHQKTPIESGEKIYIGPMPLQLQQGQGGQVEVVNEAFAEEQWAGRPLYEVEAWSLFLEVPDRDDPSVMKVLLDNISFKAMPGDMIALMGPSGAGKTTLLLALNGYKEPTEGLVRINGENLYNIYDALRGSIGYVPQDDLVHPELTVWEAVRYSAKFRLPPDYSEDEIDQRVQQTLRDLGLDGVAHLQIGSPEAKILSGGQRKRVNIALELVTDPVVMYLDEPTSGLAADDAAALIELLSKLTKATGKTIIMTIHQPAKDEYEKFTHSLILGYGGVPMFFGPTSPDSYRFFSSWAQKEGKTADVLAVETVPVDTPRDMFALITAREDPIHQRNLAANPNSPRTQARTEAARLWNADYYSDQNPTYKRMYSGRRAVGTGEGHSGLPEGRPKTRGQFRLLLSRYFKTKVRDRTGTGILFLQAPIIGVLLAMVFGGQEKQSPAWCLGALQQIAERTGEKAEGEVLTSLATTQDNTVAVFFMVASAIWFGTSNAAREIVKERAIYLRERMVNLGLLNYVMSKFILLSLFCVIQCAVLLGIVFFALGFDGGILVFLKQLGALTTTAICAVSLGLLLSTVVETSEAAQALTPIALIPQLVLGGLMVPATTVPYMEPLMFSVPARWGFEAAIVPQRDAIKQKTAWVLDLNDDELTSASDFIFNGQFECATAQMASDSLTGAWSFTTYETQIVPYAALGAMTLALFLGILVLLRKRDPF